MTSSPRWTRARSPAPAWMCSRPSRCRRAIRCGRMPNVLITPHTAGYGPHLDERRYEILRDNCRAFEAGTALRNQVDKANWF